MALLARSLNASSLRLLLYMLFAFQVQVSTESQSQAILNTQNRLPIAILLNQSHQL